MSQENNEQRKPLSENSIGTWYVWEATPHTAQSSGNESIKLRCLVKDEHGGSGFITEFLPPTLKWKVDNFLASCGEPKNSKITPEFCAKKSGTGRIRKKPGSEYFSLEFIPGAQKTTGPTTPVVGKDIPLPSADDDDDYGDIPF